MTDIKKAIKDICGACIATYGTPLCLSAICSKRICVQALQEMAEREEGCEFCIDGIYHDVLGSPCKYNCCPMCGRDLRKAVDAE